MICKNFKQNAQNIIIIINKMRAKYYHNKNCVAFNNHKNNQIVNFTSVYLFTGEK